MESVFLVKGQALPNVYKYKEREPSIWTEFNESGLIFFITKQVIISTRHRKLYAKQSIQGNLLLNNRLLFCLHLAQLSYFRNIIYN